MWRCVTRHRALQYPVHHVCCCLKLFSNPRQKLDLLSPVVAVGTRRGTYKLAASVHPSVRLCGCPPRNIVTAITTSSIYVLWRNSMALLWHYLGQVSKVPRILMRSAAHINEVSRHLTGRCCERDNSSNSWPIWTTLHIWPCGDIVSFKLDSQQFARILMRWAGIWLVDVVVWLSCISL
jgi:hypothetical protein